jgi:Bacterial protein of unknown function (DUF916)
MEIMGKIRTLRGGYLSLALIASVLAIVTWLSPVGYAQSGGRVTNNGSTQRTESGDGLKIAPLRSDLVAKPGSTVKTTVYIQNLTPEPITLKVINNDFVAGSSEDGSPSIILNENEYAPTHSLKRFMQPVPNVAVKAGERKAVEVTITVPTSAQSGGYYGAIRFAPTTSDGSGSLDVSGSVTSLILLTVPGNITENLTVKEFSIVQDGKSGSRFSSSDALKARIRLENKGNIQVAPFGDISVLKGNKVIYSGKINDISPKGLVLPDSVRKFEQPLKNIGTFGKYKIVATVGYGTNGETLTIEKSIWIIPSSYIIGLAIAVVVLVLLIAATISSLKAYKRRILRSARRR